MAVSTDEERETDQQIDKASEETVEKPDDTGGDLTPTAHGRRRRVLLGLVIAAFVVLLGAVGFLGWQLWQERERDAAAEQARQAAVDYAQVLTSIDSNKVDENFDAVLDGATGEFKDMYSQSSAQLRQLLIDNKATAHGVVLESAVQSADKDKAVVLLFVDQSVSNTQVPDPRIDRSRIKMTMEYVDGRWRASKVELP
ncbi:tetratricopeptide repeat protein [Mycolicibacterium phlei]